ncbi:MAG: acyl--CoA ligase [Oscillospiraceae bacterium]|nr:acyl--CoA ligase [Oscillospiraceae bacterium]
MKNIFRFLQDSYKKYPDNKLVHYKDKTYVYSDIYYKALGFAKLLKEQGIEEKDNVILYIENSPEYIIAYFALLYLGAVIVPINISMSSENIKYVIDDAGAKCVISTAFRTNFLKKNINIQDYKVIEIDMDKIPNTDLNDVKYFDDDSVALILYTSGTTDKPKGVMLTHKNLESNTDSILDYLNLNENDSVLVTLSFGYSYGNSLLLTHINKGALLYISHDALYPQKILQILENENLTGFSTVGSYLNILLKQDNISKKPFENLKYMTFAGESTSFEDLMKLHGLNNNLLLYVMYGQTEASARLSYLPPDKLMEKKGSCGIPIKGVTIHIVDDDGNELPCNITGEIIAKGDNIMKGYYNDSFETKEKVKDGWLYTGDIAYKDEDGFIYIVGRKNDLIKYLGHRISPLEIENEINKCENILESAVVESKDFLNNTKIKAYLVLKDKNIGILDLSENIKKSLPSFKRPHIIEIIDSLPKTFNGKIKRSLLKDVK